jgi:molecular chaperone HtpG
MEFDLSTTHEFKAEVQQILDLMIRSVYAEREVFLRELISNAADALDKARYEGLSRDDLTDAGNEVSGIRLSVDEEAGTICIEDDGIGMTEEQIVDHLGTIAKSGTKEFMNKMKASEAEQGETNLIGQFGVGFYSSFMVADKVVVESLSAIPGEKPVIWNCEGMGSYETSEGTRSTRGTKITLTLREDAVEFASIERLTAVVKRHSNYLPWPVLVDEEQKNAARALWSENPSSVSDEERNDFCNSGGFGVWGDPAHTLHTSVDSPIQYSALLFVPNNRPHDLFQQGVDRGPRLYARRVMIMEHAPALLPDWLRFVKGVVDSEDLPLNISREVAQQSPALKKISKAVTNRLLKDLQRMKAPEGHTDASLKAMKVAELRELADTFEIPTKGLKKAELIAAVSEQACAPQANPYDAIWHNFGLLLKEGYYTDTDWREKLTPLLRFNASSHDDDQGLISLTEYKEAMPEDQDTIWYITGGSRSQALASPHLEMVQSKGYDVLVLTDPVDEWLVQALTEFDEVPLKSLTQGDFSMDDGDEEGRVNIDDLVPWMGELLSGTVAEVRASTRLTKSAAVLVSKEGDITPQMAQILAQMNQAMPANERVLELNTKHPIVRGLAALHAQARFDEAQPIAELLVDEAMLLDGSMKETAAAGRRLEALLSRVCEQALAE